ncbi:hypothetical protein [Geodermatophilus sp. SYSU D00710]
MARPIPTRDFDLVDRRTAEITDLLLQQPLQIGQLTRPDLDVFSLVTFTQFGFDQAFIRIDPIQRDSADELAIAVTYNSQSHHFAPSLEVSRSTD